MKSAASIPPFPCRKSRDFHNHPAPLLNEELFVWEVKRPLLPKLPLLPVKVTEAFQQINDNQASSAETEEINQDMSSSKDLENILDNGKNLCIDRLVNLLREHATTYKSTNCQDFAETAREWLYSLESTMVIYLYQDLCSKIEKEQ